MNASLPHRSLPTEARAHRGLGEGGELLYLPSTRSQGIARVLVQSQNLGLALGSHGLDVACIYQLHRQKQLLTAAPQTHLRKL